ncbi:hypothetical protein [Burkholderia sp. TSV86]|uniref:hypothetical protein n=1 Tax=Burkholderia sp. TSV86 TaxID=1385594 RepID=UPI0018D249FF|nr:hypothetical protein [Burkholderia sp. TSV86]
MPTNSYGNARGFLGSPYISNCQFDAAGALLQWIYGPLNSEKTQPLDEGRFIEFDQASAYPIRFNTARRTLVGCTCQLIAKTFTHADCTSSFTAASSIPLPLREKALMT